VPGKTPPLRVARIDGAAGPATVELVRRRGWLRPRFEIWLRSRDGRVRLWAGPGPGRAFEVFEARVRRLQRPPVPIPARSAAWLARLLDRPLPEGVRDLALADALSDLGYSDEELREAIGACVGIGPSLWRDPSSGPLRGVDGARLARLLPELPAAGPAYAQWATALAARTDLPAHLAPPDARRLAGADSPVADTFAQACGAALLAAVGAAGLGILAATAARPAARACARDLLRGIRKGAGRGRAC